MDRPLRSRPGGLPLLPRLGEARDRPAPPSARSGKAVATGWSGVQRARGARLALLCRYARHACRGQSLQGLSRRHQGTQVGAILWEMGKKIRQKFPITEVLKCRRCFSGHCSTSSAVTRSLSCSRSRPTFDPSSRAFFSRKVGIITHLRSKRIEVVTEQVVFWAPISKRGCFL